MKPSFALALIATGVLVAACSTSDTTARSTSTTGGATTSGAGGQGSTTSSSASSGSASSGTGGTGGSGGGAPAVFCDAPPNPWTGVGATHTVVAGGDLQATIDAAQDGDTVEVDPGTWTRVELVIKKRIRLRAKQRHASILLGAEAAPATSGTASPGGNANIAITVTDAAAAGARVEGFTIRWYKGHGIGVVHTGGVVVEHNVVESCDDQGIWVYDTTDTDVRCNEVRDPYLQNGVIVPVDETSNANANSHSDYGVQVYGSKSAAVRHNYFFGRFNQTVSFKDGNVGYAITDNTFEGFSLSGVIAGQNLGTESDYPYTSLPPSIDRGPILIAGNVFRPVHALRGAVQVEYRANSAIRVAHVDADVEIRDNLVETAFSGIGIECGINGSAGCPVGTIHVHHNLVNGAVRNLQDQLVHPGISALRTDSGVTAIVTVDHETNADLGHPIRNFGTSVPLPITLIEVYQSYEVSSESGTTQITSSNFFPFTGDPGATNSKVDPRVLGGLGLQLREAKPASEPDRSMAQGYRPEPGAPGDLGGGKYRGAVAP